MLSQGLALIAAATQVFVRDLEQALAPALAMLFYLSPILYAADQTPTWVRGVMALNPVATQVATLRDAWLGGRALPTLPDVLMVVLAAVVWALGHVVFQRLSPHFEEAL
jgi:ABC-type polysaccharide/polyol phosphate export permease